MRFLLPGLLLLILFSSVSDHDTITTRVTWDREIAPIVQARCVRCHAAGGPAPMSLTTYADARPWARAIREEVLARRMPKWPVVRGYGDFSNDPSLSAFEIALITAWVDGGAPESSKPPGPRPADVRRAVPATAATAAQTADRRIACATQTLPEGRLAALEPSLPRGGSLRLTLEFPDKTVEPLLWIRDFDPRFAEAYELRRPVSIPPGTRLRTVGQPDCAVTIRGVWKK